MTASSRPGSGPGGPPPVTAAHVWALYRAGEHAGLQLAAGTGRVVLADPMYGAGLLTRDDLLDALDGAPLTAGRAAGIALDVTLQLAQDAGEVAHDTPHEHEREETGMDDEGQWVDCTQCSGRGHVYVDHGEGAVGEGCPACYGAGEILVRGGQAR